MIRKILTHILPQKGSHDITKMKDNTNIASQIGGSVSVRN